MLKTPISVLQELAVRNKFSAPDYNISGTGEPHKMSFVCEVKLDKQTATGFGATKKDAKQDAAKSMLALYGINLDSSQSQVPSMCLLPSKTDKLAGPTINYVGSLNEVCSGRRYPQPEYSDSITQSAMFCIICSLNGLESKGYGANKKAAKQEAAKKMLALLPQDGTENNNTDDKSRIDALEENNEFFKQVVKKFTELKRDVSDGAGDGKDKVETIEKEETLDCHTWEDLTELLDTHGYAYELNTFQREPLILSLKIKNYVLMDYGNSSEKIKQKFASKAVAMINNGFDFSQAAINQ